MAMRAFVATVLVVSLIIFFAQSLAAVDTGDTSVKASHEVQNGQPYETAEKRSGEADKEKETHSNITKPEPEVMSLPLDALSSNLSIEAEGAAIVGHEAEEKKRSLAIFFILLLIVMATLLVHVIIISQVHYVPESLAIVILGAVVGFLLSNTEHDWREIEALSPDVFFLVLLPPIIFENAYNLNKGHFFSNIWPILTFAILGTAISAAVIGTAVYALGQIGMVYSLSIFESFAFASMISAVDPVATLAIFQAVKVEGLLYMLVFGESMLNDAVSIVLAATSLRHSRAPYDEMGGWDILTSAAYTFSFMFVASGILGAGIGLMSALLFKHVDLRKTPSLEFALLLVFAYIPYGLAEALSLSGIMAVLLCGIVMSQYTQHNISPVTQITMRHTFRTIAFVAETSTFAYLGLAFFTIKLNFQPAFIVWSIILCLVSRACNVFPLSWLVNKCRKDMRISTKNQIIMWFSGMRGAVCFALALYVDVDTETKSVILTTTLFLLLFTIVFIGGTALPFINFINRCYPTERTRRRRQRSVRRDKKKVLLSKTQEMSLFGNEEWSLPKMEDAGTAVGRVMRMLFVRKFTAQEKQENREKLRNLTRRALKTDNSSESESEREGHDDAPLLSNPDV